MAALCCLLASGTDERMVLGDRRRRFLRTTPNNLLELAILVGKALVSALFLFCKRETWRRKRSVNESKDGGLKGRR